jgi:ATP-dependent DNA helicase RecG
MLQSNTSRPHNPLIANTFFRCGFIESWGRGIDKMNKACIADGLPSPVYQTISDSIIVKFEGHNPEEFIDKKTGNVKYWNSNAEKEKELEIKQKIERISKVFERVNERVKNELQIIYSIIEDNPLIKISSIEKINNKSNATNRRYLKILKDNNLIEYIGSDKIGGYKIIVN